MASYTCRRCSRTFSNLQNAQPESAFVPPAGEYIDPHIADDMASRKGMTNLAPRDIPEGEKAAPGAKRRNSENTMAQEIGAYEADDRKSVVYFRDHKGKANCNHRLNKRSSAMAIGDITTCSRCGKEFERIA